MDLSKRQVNILSYLEWMDTSRIPNKYRIYHILGIFVFKSIIIWIQTYSLTFPFFQKCNKIWKCRKILELWTSFIHKCHLIELWHWKPDLTRRSYRVVSSGFKKWGGEETPTIHEKGKHKCSNPNSTPHNSPSSRLQQFFLLVVDWNVIVLSYSTETSSFSLPHFFDFTQKLYGDLWRVKSDIRCRSIDRMLTFGKNIQSSVFFWNISKFMLYFIKCKIIN